MGGIFDWLDPKSLFGGGGGGGGDPASPTIVPMGQPQDINAEGDANQFDPKKAYGFGTSKIGDPSLDTEESKFQQMRRKQMGAGGS